LIRTLFSANFVDRLVVALVKFELVDQWRIRYEKQQHKVRSEKETRKRFEEYRRYLLVFDLRKAGLSRKEIVEKVFPEHGAMSRKCFPTTSVKQTVS